MATVTTNWQVGPVFLPATAGAIDGMTALGTGVEVIISRLHIVNETELEKLVWVSIVDAAANDAAGKRVISGVKIPARGVQSFPGPILIPTGRLLAGFCQDIGNVGNASACTITATGPKFTTT